jgi:hypothetical protein
LISTSYLLPHYHRFYWMGYRNGGGLSGAWSASFTWIDKSNGIDFSDYNRCGW